MEFNEVTATTSKEILSQLVVDPEVFGFALLASTAIRNGQLTICARFMNNTPDVVTIDWINSHIFLVHIVASDGSTFDVNQLLPPPIPQPPQPVNPKGEFQVQYVVDTTKYPYAGRLAFDRLLSPYKFFFECNSTTYPFTASCQVPVQ
jgi:hypothetical protein